MQILLDVGIIIQNFIRGCNGFDGDFESGNSHPQTVTAQKNRTLKIIDNDYALAAA